MRAENIKIFFAPDTCARVTLTALEEIGCEYEREVIVFLQGGHVHPDYLKINPVGGVPALLIDGHGLFENSAILKYLDEVFPDAGLLPKTSTPLDRWEQNAIFTCLSGDIHPRLPLMRFPMLITPVEEAYPSMGQIGAQGIKQKMAWLNARLENQPWLLGDAWSILDAYLSWAWFRTVGSYVPANTFPAIDDMSRRNAERPSAKRVAKIEADAIADLKINGLWPEPKK